MPILDAGQRRYMLEKHQQYLFSYDVAFNTAFNHVVPVSGGLETYVVAKKREGRVFHVLDDGYVLGNQAVVGELHSLEQTISIPVGATSGRVEDRMIFGLSDGYLFGFSQGVVRLWRGTLGDRYTVPDADRKTPQELKAQATVRFETANQKYKWLTTALCASYGTYQVEGDKILRAAFDVYALG
jgi:hypothetical protein